jgi:hypothetical protein
LQIQYVYHAIVMTNNPRQRRPGGGRKPAGPIKGKTSNFSTRITAETRQALDNEAKASGHSISQVAERVLQLGLAALRDRERRDPTRALVYLIGWIADASSIASPGSNERLDWNEEPFVFEAFERALAMLLKELRPAGPSRLKKYLADHNAHAVHREILATPEGYANHIFWELWDDLTAQLKPIDADALRHLYPEAQEALELSRYTYGLDHARRDLKIGEKKS